MNTIKLPGFTAEAALYQTSERYAAVMDRAGSSDASAVVQPARFLDIIFDPCNYCFQNCARQTRLPTGGRDCLEACRFAGLC